MPGIKKTYIALFGSNRLENLQIILCGWVRRLQMYSVATGIILPERKALNRVPFIMDYVKKSIRHYNIRAVDYKGLWYEITKDTTDLTIKFYDEQLRENTKVVAYYNKILNTNKFEAYVKKQISLQLYSALEGLHVIKLRGLHGTNILICRNPVNELAVSHMENKYGIKYRVKWVSSEWNPFHMLVYYRWLVMEFLRRGVTFKKARKKYKLSVEAAWGFYMQTMRNDMLMDRERFTKKDVLILEFEKTKTPPRTRIFKEAKEMDFDVVSVPELKININKNISAILSFYFLIPIRTFFRLFSEKRLYIFRYMLLFHKGCFPIEVLLNLYDIKCHISTKDWGDIEETIIMNKYGTKNILFHWSDLSVYKAHSHAFIAHNVCYTWGDIHYSYYLDTYFVDKRVNIGCIYKREFNNARNNRNNILMRIPQLRENKKIVVFFDSTFSKSLEHNEDFFIEYMTLIKEFCERNGEVNALLKPKVPRSYESELSTANQNRYEGLRDKLAGCQNFNCLDASKWSFEEAIAISDVCVSMGMNTPSTIALICGKNALYFNGAGNIYHPFARKYKNIITFEDKDSLCRQIGNILDGRFNCADVITEKEIRAYDAYPDDNALERLKDSVYELTTSDSN